MAELELKLNKFRQSQSTVDFKEHYGIVNKYADTGVRVLKLGRGYFDWQFFVRPGKVQEELEKDVRQFQGYLSPLGEKDTRTIILAYESNFGKYSLGNVAFTSSVLTTFPRIAEIIRTSGKEELIIARPNYPQLEEDAVRHGPVTLIDGKMENGYNVTAREIENAITNKTSGVVLLNPNIAGIYHNPEELGRIIEVAEKKDVFLILDETNDTIQWKSEGMIVGKDGVPLIERSHYPSNIDSPNIIRLRSFSKGDMLAEYRLGYAVAAPDVIAALEQSVGANTPPSSATEAVKWILSTQGKWASKGGEQSGGGMDYIDELGVNSRFMDAARKYITAEVLKVQGADVINPKNGFNIFFKVPDMNGWQLFEKLLYDCKFAVNPGTCFGFANSDGWVRFTLSNAPDKLQTSMKRFNSVFGAEKPHSRFTFGEITSMRVWEHCKTELEEFLP